MGKSDNLTEILLRIQWRKISHSEISFLTNINEQISPRFFQPLVSMVSEFTTFKIMAHMSPTSKYIFFTNIKWPRDHGWIEGMKPIPPKGQTVFLVDFFIFFVIPSSTSTHDIHMMSRCVKKGNKVHEFTFYGFLNKS